MYKYTVTVFYLPLELVQRISNRILYLYLFHMSHVTQVTDSFISRRHDCFQRVHDDVSLSLSLSLFEAIFFRNFSNEFGHAKCLRTLLETGFFLSPSASKKPPLRRRCAASSQRRSFSSSSSFPSARSFFFPPTRKRSFSSPTYTSFLSYL